MADLFRAEMLAEVPRERINPDAFDGLCVAMQCVELTSALRVAEILPVGGFVASAREAWLFDEGFQQYRAIGIACVPVLGQAPAGQGKDPRGEVFTVYPRQNEEARVVDDEVQVAATLCARPADDVVARFDFPGARTEAERGDYVPFGAHEVTQLCPWHQLMTQVVVALDIRVPQQRVALVAHQIDAEPSKVDSRDTAGLEHRVLDVGILPIRDRLGVSRRWQRDQTSGLHAQQCHTATHVFELTIRTSPVQTLAHFARETKAADLRESKQLTDYLDLVNFKMSCAVLHRSVRRDQAHGLQGVQHFHRFVQPHPAAPEHEHAGFPVPLAPQVTPELAEHAHRLAQRRRLPKRGRCVGQARVQHLDFDRGEHLRSRQIRLHACQVGHVHQAHADDAEESQIAHQALRLFKQAVLDLAAGLEHFVPSLDAPALAVPSDLLGGALEAVHGQIRQQHPAHRLTPRGRIVLRRRHDVHTDRLEGCQGFRLAAPVRGLDRHLRNAHLDVRRARCASTVAGNVHRHRAERRSVRDRLEDAATTLTVIGYQQPVGTRADEEKRAILLGLREKFEEVRFPIGHRNDLHAQWCTRLRLAQRQQPLGALLLLDCGALQALDLLLIVLLRYLSARPDALAQDPQRHTGTRESQRIVHDQPMLACTAALTDRTQTARLRMLAVGKENGILHHQHRAAMRSHALDGRLNVRLENRRRTGLRIVKQPIRRLRARPIATRFVNRRGGRFSQLFCRFAQATIQTFVGQIGTDELPRHPFHRLGASFDDSVHLGVFISRRFVQVARYSSPLTSRRPQDYRKQFAVSSALSANERQGVKRCV
jgi:hypothetical protein